MTSCLNLSYQVIIERFPPKRKKRLHQKKQKKKGKHKDRDDDEEDEADYDKDDEKRSESDENGPVETDKVMFVCNRWLARSEDDGQIVRELVPCDMNGKLLRRNSLTSKQEKTPLFLK